MHTNRAGSAWIRINFFNRLYLDPHWDRGSGSGSRRAEMTLKSEQTGFEVLVVLF